MRSSGNSAVGAAVRRVRPLALLFAAAFSSVLLAQTSDPKTLYNEALQLEGALRKELTAHPANEPADALLKRIRTLAGSYRDLSRLFPSSGYSDNALWQGGLLAADAYWKFGDPADRATALRLLRDLPARFPTSSLVKQVPAQITRLETSGQEQSLQAPPPPAATPPPAPPTAAAAALRPQVRQGQSLLKAIRREALPDALRITLELEREVAFHDERLDGPPRVFVDLHNTRPADELKDATIPFSDDVVKQVRVGRQADARTRVVLDLVAPGRHSVYALYNPYRLIIDLERPGPNRESIGAREPGRDSTPDPRVLTPDAAAATERPTPTAAPAAPAANAGGGFSLSRQLGLGVGRIVIDPGHGGHDPGAKIRGLTEAELVLDVALRLEKLLKKEGVDVVLTRRSNAYLTLEERTAIANQSSADLFLSIHANASTIAAASGVETYFLNFAQNKEAEAIAARENAGSAKSMHQLPDIVRAIALNNKLDESRDFARMVQASLYDRLRKVHKGIKNLGVKQAPFMVLIGATMPAILSEIAFMTNRDEATLLRTERYRQQIAEALQAGIMRYQESLKKSAAVAAR